MTFIAPIVEGHGEQQAAARLLRRIASEAAPGAFVKINEPIRVKSGSFINDENYFARYLALAAAKARQANGCVLVLLDCEDDCPATLGPVLAKRAEQAAADVMTIVALAYREYETWFMAAATSLAGVEGFAHDVTPPANAEATRNAKGWLGRNMPHGYDPISHQLPFTSAFDLSAARAIPSFARLCSKIAALVTTSSA